MKWPGSQTSRGTCRPHSQWLHARLTPASGPVRRPPQPAPPGALGSLEEALAVAPSEECWWEEPPPGEGSACSLLPVPAGGLGRPLPWPVWGGGSLTCVFQWCLAAGGVTQSDAAWSLRSTVPTHLVVKPDPHLSPLWLMGGRVVCSVPVVTRAGPSRIGPPAPTSHRSDSQGPSHPHQDPPWQLWAVAGTALGRSA